MLRNDELKAKHNPCENIIHITYYGKDKRADAINLLKELKSKFPDMHGDFPDDEIYTDLGFTSEWVAPLQFLQHICNKYNVDIIGVAYEFEGGYVEAFELKNQLVDEEIKSETSEITLLPEDLGLEEVTKLPETQDEDILDSEFPDPERLDLSDEEILKSYQ